MHSQRAGRRQLTRKKQARREIALKMREAHQREKVTLAVGGGGRGSGDDWSWEETLICISKGDYDLWQAEVWQKDTLGGGSISKTPVMIKRRVCPELRQQVGVGGTQTLATQSVPSGPAPSLLPGSSLEMQAVRPHPRRDHNLPRWFMCRRSKGASHTERSLL